MGAKGKRIAYWIVTSFFAVSMLLSGLGQLMKLGENVELIENIGYPLYIMNILGGWKILAVIAIVLPGFPRLKEWAHAGVFFLMTGAALSHAFASDYGTFGFNITLPLFYAALNIASWALRPESRVLGSLLGDPKKRAQEQRFNNTVTRTPK